MASIPIRNRQYRTTTMTTAVFTMERNSLIIVMILLPKTEAIRQVTCSTILISRAVTIPITTQAEREKIWMPLSHSPLMM